MRLGRISQVLSIIILSIMIFFSCTGGGCKQGTLTTELPNNGNESIEIIYISTHQVTINGSFTVDILYNLDGSKPVYLKVYSSLGTGCYLLERYIGNFSGNGTIEDYTVSVSELQQYCNGTSINNTGVSVYPKAGSGSEEVLSNRWQTVVIGIIKYKVDYYYATGMNCLPDNWDNLKRIYDLDCYTQLVETNGEYHSPYTLPNGDYPYGESDLFTYMTSYYTSHGYNNQNLSKAFLIGMGRVDGFAPNVIGTSLKVTEYPPAGFVFVNKIDNLTGEGWDATKRRRLKTVNAAHELGEARGLNHTDGHTSDFGSNYDRCFMEAYIDPLSEQIDNTGFRCCSQHGNQFGVIWWYPNP